MIVAVDGIQIIIEIAIPCPKPNVLALGRFEHVPIVAEANHITLQLLRMPARSARPLLFSTETPFGGSGGRVAVAVGVGVGVGVAVAVGVDA